MSSLLNACFLYVMLEYAIVLLYGFLNKVNLVLFYVVFVVFFKCILLHVVSVTYSPTLVTQRRTTL